MHEAQSMEIYDKINCKNQGLPDCREEDNGSLGMYPVQ